MPVGVITFFVYPKGVGHDFFSFDKGGHVFLWGVLLVATAPPVEMMNGLLSDSCHPKIEKYVTWGLKSLRGDNCMLLAHRP